MQMPKTAAPLEIQIWPIDRFVLYARNPRKNDSVVDRMCSSIREFGFKIPVLARNDGEVVDGHLRIKAARKLRIEEIPVIVCDEWTPAQVKAFRLMVNRSVNWASWNDELLALELQELSDADFDLSLSGFDDAEVIRLLAAGDAVEGLTDEDSVPGIPKTPIARPASLAQPVTGRRRRPTSPRGWRAPLPPRVRRAGSTGRLICGTCLSTAVGASNWGSICRLRRFCLDRTASPHPARAVYHTCPAIRGDRISRSSSTRHGTWSCMKKELGLCRDS
jgi:hypothetical protein